MFLLKIWLNRVQVKALHQQVLAAKLHVDLLVNNAGYGRWGQFGEFTRGDYAAMIS